MKSVLSLIGLVILSYGPALTIAIMPITIDSRHILASQKSRKRAGEIISDTVPRGILQVDRRIKRV